MSKKKYMIIFVIVLLLLSITSTVFAENIEIDDGEVIITPITESETPSKTPEPSATESTKAVASTQPSKSVSEETKASAVPEATITPTPSPTPTITVKPIEKAPEDNTKEEEETPKALVEFLFNKAMAGSTVEIRLNNDFLEQLVLDDEGTARTMVPIDALEILTFIVVDKGELVANGTANPDENKTKNTTAPLGQKELEEKQKTQTNSSSSGSFFGYIILLLFICVVIYMIYGKIKKKKQAEKAPDNSSDYDEIYDDNDYGEYDDEEAVPVTTDTKEKKQNKQKNKPSKEKKSIFRIKAKKENVDDIETEESCDYDDKIEDNDDLEATEFIASEMVDNTSFLKATKLDVKSKSDGFVNVKQDISSFNQFSGNNDVTNENEIIGTYETYDNNSIKSKRCVKILESKPILPIVFAEHIGDNEDNQVEPKQYENELIHENIDNNETTDTLNQKSSDIVLQAVTDSQNLPNSKDELTEEQKQTKIQKFNEMYNALIQISQLMKFNVKETTETTGDKNKRLEIIHEIYRENCIDVLKFVMSVNISKILRDASTSRIINFINCIKKIKDKSLNVYDRNALIACRGIKYEIKKTDNDSEYYVFWF